MTDQRGGGAFGVAEPGVSDEVWRVISAEGERAAARERGALLRVVGVVSVVTVAAALLAFSGLVTPRLSGGNTAGGGGGGQGAPYFVDFTLHNQGVTPVSVVGFSSRVEGVEVLASTPTDLRIGPRAGRPVHVSFRTTDCDRAVPDARRLAQGLPGAALGVVVDRPWGEVRTDVDPVISLADLVLSSCGQDQP